MMDQNDRCQMIDNDVSWFLQLIIDDDDDDDDNDDDDDDDSRF